MMRHEPRSGVLYLVLTLIVGLFQSGLVAASAQVDPEGEEKRSLRLFRHEDMPELTDAFADLMEAAFAAERRERIVRIYRRAGLESVGAFYEAGLESMEAGTLRRGRKLTYEEWGCLSVDVRRSVDAIADALSRERLEDAQKLALELGVRESGSCEAAMLWAWCEVGKNLELRSVGDAERAIRILVTAVEDGVPLPAAYRLTQFEVYEAVAIKLAVLGDGLSAAVAAL